MTNIKKINMDLSGMDFSQDHWPIVHKSQIPNLSTEFYGTDNREDFLLNLQKMPSDWIYRDRKINYKFNSVGLRMDKELDRIDSRYMIGIGCSHTVGVGVNLNDTWLHLVANELNLDYINNSASGSSVKLCAINFFNMLGKLDKLPLIVAFSWPSTMRYCFYSNDGFVFYLPRFISEDINLKYHTKAYENLIMTDALNKEAIFYRNMIKITCDRLGIKYAEFTFDSLDKIDNMPVAYIDVHDRTFNTGYARDIRSRTDTGYVSHPGTAAHLIAKKLILEQI